MGQFVATVLGYTEDTWHDLFGRMGRQYREPTLVLFSGAVDSACGFAQAAMGPFYCPADEKLYVDLVFYRELRDRFGAPGDFAQAYVIAHEVGHHVQNQLGIAEEVQSLRQQVSESDAQCAVGDDGAAGGLSGRGVGAPHPAHPSFLEEGDLEEGLNAAAAIGDDQMQRRAQGYVIPDAFTHGSSARAGRMAAPRPRVRRRRCLRHLQRRALGWAGRSLRRRPGAGARCLIDGGGRARRGRLGEVRAVPPSNAPVISSTPAMFHLIGALEASSSLAAPTQIGTSLSGNPPGPPSTLPFGDPENWAAVGRNPTPPLGKSGRPAGREAPASFSGKPGAVPTWLAGRTP